MKRFLIIPAFAALAACEGGLAIPDFRGSGGEDRGLFRTAPTASEADVSETGPLTATTPLVAKDRLVAATEANGCVINVTTIANIMQEAAIGNDELAGIVTELETDGLIATEGTDGLRLQTPTCTA